ncbi:MAG TPA: right-handed parallel beta-helix repeat-containing protein, partial [Gemmatimonadaceae bacterium]|nr:right-handed parallel beta-helix repeat-containing protein [Gemmatimonadaceae bacterium]
LTDIYIERNRILDMGLDGIGVVGFWNLRDVDEMISVDRLTIVRNEINRCLRRQLAPIRAPMLAQMGYGGIALADVEYLVIRENVIENNGLDFTQPICGIFVLHGEGIDITDNRIRNNGAKTREPMSAAKDGARGGIVIVFAIAPAIPTDVTFLSISLPSAPVQNGVPALRVHDNIVSAPVGQALSAVALGPTSVHANSLTTHGIAVPRGHTTAATFAATVSIVNLGLSNEIYLQLLAFALLAHIALGLPGVVETDDAIIIPAAGLDDLGIGRLLADGTVQFTDNQVVLDLLQSGTSVALSSILIVSLDDVAFADNQCSSNLAADIVLIQAIVLGFTVRVEANRFTESLVLALLSALTYGVANTTTHNQATHCIIADASTLALRTNTPNTILHPSAFCARAANIRGTLNI